MNHQLHEAQVSILTTLRHMEEARFSTLMRPTDLQSDTFKFHLRKLAKLGLLEKSKTGQYRLTPQGKEFANNFDEERQTVQRLPKLSLLLLVPHPVEHDQQEIRYLFQRRLRSPFFGFWSCIGGPVPWGVSAEDAAAKELTKQTGLTAKCQVRSFYRQSDYDKTSEALLEDKLFVILEAVNVTGELSNTWYAGFNQWMTLSEFTSMPKYFSSVCDALRMIEDKKVYATSRTTYSKEDY